MSLDWTTKGEEGVLFEDFWLKMKWWFMIMVWIMEEAL